MIGRARRADEEGSSLLLLEVHDMVIARFLKQCLEASKKSVPRFAQKRLPRSAKVSTPAWRLHKSNPTFQLHLFKRLLSGDGIPDPDAGRHTEPPPCSSSFPFLTEGDWKENYAGVFPTRPTRPTYRDRRPDSRRKLSYYTSDHRRLKAMTDARCPEVKVCVYSHHF